MPPIQTTYASKPKSGFPGMMADAAEWNANSGFVVAANVKPGSPVQGNGQDRQFVPLTTGTFVGIMRSHITNQDEDGDFILNTMNAAIDEGHIFVRAAGVCTPRGPVYWDAANGGYSDDDGGVEIPGAEFLTGGVVGDDVVVNLRRVPGL